MRPNHFTLASGSVIRKALQSLENINWVEKAPKGGRRLTKQVSSEQVPGWTSPCLSTLGL